MDMTDPQGKCQRGELGCESTNTPEGNSVLPSQLFTLRVWREALGHGQSEWRGRLEHVLSGEAHCFRDWPTLLARLQDMLDRHAQAR